MHTRLKTFLRTVLVSFVAMAQSSRTVAQCELAWDPQFAPAGASSVTQCAAVFDDGSGPALYVGGQFTIIGGIFAFSIARYDGESWSNVGAPYDAFNGFVGAMAVFDDGNGPALYAAGSFTDIGGVAVSRIAKWNGTAWSAPTGGGFDVAPTKLFVSSAVTGTPRLYAMGLFATAGSSTVPGFAVYDGTTWANVGDGSLAGRCMVEFDDPATAGSDLFISGSRTREGGGIFRFDGSSFHNIVPLHTGGTLVLCMAAFDDGNGSALYAGGTFSTMNDTRASRIAKWNGTSWSAVGGGVTSTVQYLVRDLCVWDDGSGPALFAGGRFQTAGGTPANNVAKWDGSAWSALSTGVNNSPSGFPEAKDLLLFDSGGGEGLAILGDFTTPRQYMAFWNGTEMRGLGGTNGVGAPLSTAAINDLVIYEDANDGPLLVAGGSFVNAGPMAANRIAAWDGRTWRAFGAGFNAEVVSLVIFDDGGGPQLYVSGTFGYLNGTQTVMDRFARWDGSQWHNVGSPPQFPGMSALDMIVFDDGDGPAIYAVSRFSSGEVVKWDGQLWTTVGTPLGRSANRLAVFDDGSGPALYLGAFSSQTGAAANDSLLKFDGNDWVPVGGGLQIPDFTSAVLGLAPFEYNGKPVLAVSGRFDGAGAVQSKRVIFWDGAQWIPTPGPPPANVSPASAGISYVHDDGTGPALYVSGIDVASTTYNDTLAKLTPRGWQSVSYGIAGGAHNAMLSYDTEGGSSLYIAGGFQWYYTAPTLGIAQKRVGGITRWFTCLDEPGIVSDPDDQSALPASNVAFDVSASGGALSYRWRRNAVPLNNNAQQSGVDSPHLTLNNVDESDEGDYDVVLTNAAGSVISEAATLAVLDPCACAGDVTNNGTVNTDDLIEIITQWGPCAGCSGDVAPCGGNGFINTDDLIAVITTWGSCP